jgi:hypothetical protein
MSEQLTAQALAYRARALAQAHPLTKLARQYLDWAVASQRLSQPLPEIGIWAGSALLEGYCVRRVEEEDLHLEVHPSPASAAGSGSGAGPGVDSVGDPSFSVSLEQLDEAAASIAADLRTGSSEGGPSPWGHQDPAMHERMIVALDRIVASQVANRLEHWRDSVDDEAWGELEEYIVWWVVKGYALRVAEMDLGAVRQ